MGAHRQEAFTASSTILAIYIQQFWDTMCFNSSTGLYSCQLDEQWFNLHKDILRDALDITPTNDDNPFVAPPSSDTVLEYVNTLGYPSTLRSVSVIPRHPVLQILWGIIHSSNIDYAERIWEEFVQSIQTFLTDRKNLDTALRGKKKTVHLLIPSVRYVGKDGREIFEEEEAATESPKATKVTKPKAAKVKKPAGDNATKPTSTLTPKTKPAPTQPSKVVPEKKQKLAGPNPGNQDEGQAGPKPGDQDEGQAGSNPGDAAESQPKSSHVENFKLSTEDQVILEEPASFSGTLSSLQNLKKDLSFTDQFFMEKPQEEEPGKTNAEVEVQSMVSVPIHQDTSSVPPMTTLVIDLTMSQSDSPLPTSTATISTITTTTTTLLPPPP
ncbi:hypothetical protein Tco_0912683 [Tanacetum coccineum]